MALTRDIHVTIRESLRGDPEYAKAVLVEITELFASKEYGTARLMLRDLVEAVVGVERVANATATSAEGLRQMLTLEGNPSTEQLAAIIDIAHKCLGTEMAQPPKAAGPVSPQWIS